MLDFAPSPDTRPCSMLSLDFGQYLLSASPPNSGFSLGSLSLTSSYNPYSFLSPSTSSPSSACTKLRGPSPPSRTSALKSIMSSPSKNNEASKDSSDNPEDNPEDSTTSVLSEVVSLRDVSSSQSSYRKARRRVSFADDMGQPLAEVRLMLDNPASPPSLAGVAGLQLDSDNGNPESVLSAPDPQPMGRASFEDELRHNMMAVENVWVNHLEVNCTTLIDIRPSSKRVFGRCTMDSWQSFQDVQASHCGLAKSGYDRYKFEFNVPSTADRSHSIQFAVCFEADGTQYWDNNEGNNFIVHWKQSNRTENHCLLNANANANAIDYGDLVWCCHDDLSHPYY